MSVSAGSVLEAPRMENQLREAAQFVRERLECGAGGAVEIGRRLQQVHDAVGRRRFQAWLKAEFAWSRVTATKYMCAARVFGQSEAVKRIQTSAVYLLARQHVSPVARQEALRMAGEGLPVSKKTALELIRQHSEPKPPRDRQGWESVFNRATKLPLPELLKLTTQLVQFLRKSPAAAG